MVLEGRVEGHPQLLKQLGLGPFRQRLPWWGGDLQTLRDTLRRVSLPEDHGQPIEIPVPALASGAAGPGKLLAMLDLPLGQAAPLALVLMLHGLGGSSRREGLRRMAIVFQQAGFAVLRLNLRGADPGRQLAGGTYAAECNSDLGPVLQHARKLCRQLAEDSAAPMQTLPLLGAGISLGGTMLLNACLQLPQPGHPQGSVLDGLVCLSSPLDLDACSRSIERPRNRIYKNWLLKRLVRQTLADPYGVSEAEQRALGEEEGPPASMRAFDAAITAPRWGYADVESYYRGTSPLPALLENPGRLPQTLVMQAMDDPWVPVAAAQQLAKHLASSSAGPLQVLLTEHGGHNGFHGTAGCWGDQLAVNWLLKLAGC